MQAKITKYAHRIVDSPNLYQASQSLVMSGSVFS